MNITMPIEQAYTPRLRYARRRYASIISCHRQNVANCHTRVYALRRDTAAISAAL